jgi:hypothetical protein
MLLEKRNRSLHRSLEVRRTDIMPAALILVELVSFAMRLQNIGEVNVSVSR